MERNSRVNLVQDLGSAGMVDLLGRRASGRGRTLELSLLELGQCRDDVFLGRWMPG